MAKGEGDGDEEYRFQEKAGGKPVNGWRRTSDMRWQSYTAEEEQAVVRKFDKRLVVFMALLYLLSFLDRSSMYPLS
jgi:hypothetical protein